MSNSITYSLTRRSALLFFSILIVAACSRTPEFNVERGSEFVYEPGHPEVTASAIGLVDEEQNPYIQVTAHISRESLIYSESEEGEGRVAELEMEVQIAERGEERAMVTTETLQKKVQEATFEESFFGNTLPLEKRVDIEPGVYDIYVTITDLSSDKRVTRQIETMLPDFEDGEFTLSNIQLYGKNKDEGDDWIPITSYHVRSSADSLRFVFQVISQRTDEPLELNSRLIRFRSDTNPAHPMHEPNPGPSSIVRKGIDYSKYEEIQSTRRVLEHYESTTVEFRFAAKERGNYRFETTASRADAEDVYKAREFNIVSKNFPSVKTPRELAMPLTYLMGERDHERMMEIEDPDSLKEAVDRFWLENVQSINQARDVIAKYYERVEEANKQFSNFKEGWKTDQGMIYILYGPPWYAETTSLTRTRWLYGYNRFDPTLTFYFRQPFVRTESFPFNHHILERNHRLYESQYRQTSLWLNGLILRRNI